MTPNQANQQMRVNFVAEAELSGALLFLMLVRQAKLGASCRVRVPVDRDLRVSTRPNQPIISSVA